jgi:hypothetical protein
MSVMEQFHDFFVAAAGVAGALIGLLFVAITVAHERFVKGEQALMHRLRAQSALTAFTNALVVSLLGLDPAVELSTATIAVGCSGMAFVLASLISLVRTGELNRHLGRDLAFLAGLIAVFALQIVTGIHLGDDPDQGDVNTVAILVVVSFLIGISRAWELVGAPNIGITSEVVAAVRRNRELEGVEHDDDADDDEATRP